MNETLEERVNFFFFLCIVEIENGLFSPFIFSIFCSFWEKIINGVNLKG